MLERLGLILGKKNQSGSELEEYTTGETLKGVKMGLSLSSDMGATGRP